MMSLVADDIYKWFRIGSDNALVPARKQAIILTNDGIYASLDLNELKQMCNMLYMHWSYHIIKLTWISLWLKLKDNFHNNKQNI